MVDISKDIPDLTANKTYYYKITATNSVGSAISTGTFIISLEIGSELYGGVIFGYNSDTGKGWVVQKTDYSSVGQPWQDIKIAREDDNTQFWRIPSGFELFTLYRLYKNSRINITPLIESVDYWVNNTKTYNGVIKHGCFNTNNTNLEYDAYSLNYREDDYYARVRLITTF